MIIHIAGRYLSVRVGHAPRTTNINTVTRDVRRFSFEYAGAHEVTNEYSGLAVIPAHLYCFRRSQACMSLIVNLAF